MPYMRGCVTRVEKRGLARFGRFQPVVLELQAYGVHHIRDQGLGVDTRLGHGDLLWLLRGATAIVERLVRCCAT